MHPLRGEGLELRKPREAGKVAKPFGLLVLLGVGPLPQRLPGRRSSLELSRRAPNQRPVEGN